MSRLGSQLQVIADVARARELRRILLGFSGFSISEHATWLAVLFYALQQGGAREVGIVAVVQLLPGVLLTPFSAYAGDRFRPHRALAAGYAVQCVTMVITAAAMWADQSLVAYAAAAGAATAISFTRPVVGSLLPKVTHAPGDLIASNVVAGFIEQMGVFVGPLLAGAIMFGASPAAVFAAAAVLTGSACIATLTVSLTDDDLPLGDGAAGAVLAQVFAGFAALRSAPRLRILVGLIACAGLIKGIADVAFVTFAEDRLGGGGGQSGVLAGAYGLGGIVGAVSVTRLIHSGKISGQFIAAGFLAAGSLSGLAVAAQLPPALVALALMGAGESLLLLTAMVTIQRQAPTGVLARLFGIVEGVQMGAIAVGSLAVSMLVASTGMSTAYVVLAGTLAATIAVLVVLVRRFGDDTLVDDAVVRRLLDDALFAPLPAPTIERLARAATTQSFSAGDAIVAEGDEGDRYFIITSGTADVTMSGRFVRTLGPGDSFGEIALLRDVPRTATVTPTGAVEALAIGRDGFLEAVTGHPRSVGTATERIDRFLAPDAGSDAPSADGS